MITGMHHTGFVVKDLERSVAFYRDVVGLTVADTLELEGKEISQIVDYDGTHLLIVLLTAGDSHTLELVQYVRPQGAGRPSDERNFEGASHLAFTVDDIQETFQHLISRGAVELNPPVEARPGTKACYLRDPDGNSIELLEFADR